MVLTDKKRAAMNACFIGAVEPLSTTHHDLHPLRNLPVNIFLAFNWVVSNKDVLETRHRDKDASTTPDSAN
jgi:hypothetical protein